MSSLVGFNHLVIRPLALVGLTSALWDIHLDTILFTWISMAALTVVILIARRLLQKPDNLFLYGVESVIGFFADLNKESFGRLRVDCFNFVTALFFFTFFCNLMGLFPWMREPTEDLNTALALGITSFCYVQYQGILQHGLLGHFHEYLEPFFLLLPLNIVSELAKALSMSLRLFGNILGGSIIFAVLLKSLEFCKEYVLILIVICLGITILFNHFSRQPGHPHVATMVRIAAGILCLVPCVQLFFGLFEAFIQAFVIAVLTLTYLSMTIPTNEADEQKSDTAHLLEES